MIPHGYCQCGCGEKTNLARQDVPEQGYKKGEPFPYLRNHRKRKSPVEYREEDRGHDTPCWVWQRKCWRNGYGVAWREGREVSAHRWHYEEYRGPIPEGLEIDHLCRVKPCVNPDHMEAVTRVVNMRRGVAKLSLDDVRLIRRSGETPTELAKTFGVATNTVRAVLSRRTFVEVV